MSVASWPANHGITKTNYVCYVNRKCRKNTEQVCRKNQT